MFRFFQNFSFFHKSRVEFGLNMAIFEALVRRRGIRKFLDFPEKNLNLQMKVNLSKLGQNRTLITSFS